jgi:acyl carrier protein
MQSHPSQQSHEIRATVRRLIGEITRIPEERIEEGTSFREELKIDSLSLIEIGVAVDYEFRLDSPEEAFQAVDTLAQTVELVEQQLAAKAAVPAAK